MSMKKILHEMFLSKRAFAGTPKAPLTEDKPKAAPSDEKLKTMGNKDATKMTGAEPTGITRSLDKEKDFKPTKKDVEDACNTDGYGNEVKTDLLKDLVAQSVKDAYKAGKSGLVSEAGERDNGDKDKEDGEEKPQEPAKKPAPAPNPPATPKPNQPTPKPGATDNGEGRSGTGNTPADQAHKLGLTSKGYGYWADKSGKTVAQTVKGNLVKVEPGQDAAINPDNLRGDPMSGNKPEKAIAEPSSKLSPMVGAHKETVQKQLEVTNKLLEKHGGNPYEAARTVQKMGMQARQSGNRDQQLAAQQLEKDFFKGVGLTAGNLCNDTEDYLDELEQHDPRITQADWYKPVRALAQAMGEGLNSGGHISKSTTLDFYDAAEWLNGKVKEGPDSIDPKELLKLTQTVRDLLGNDRADDREQRGAPDPGHGADEARGGHDDY